MGQGISEVKMRTIYVSSITYRYPDDYDDDVRREHSRPFPGGTA